jgi:hypothetical protein
MADETKDPITHMFYKAVGTLLGIGIAVGVVLTGIVGFVVWLVLP